MKALIILKITVFRRLLFQPWFPLNHLRTTAPITIAPQLQLQPKKAALNIKKQPDFLFQSLNYPILHGSLKQSISCLFFLLSEEHHIPGKRECHQHKGEHWWLRDISQKMLTSQETTMQEHQHHDCHSHPLILITVSWFSGLVWPSSHWKFRWLLSLRHKAHPLEQGQTPSVTGGDFIHNPTSNKGTDPCSEDESPEWGTRFSLN